MKKIEVELSDGEYKALSIISYSPEEWVINAAKNRARIAIDTIVSKIVEESLENGTAIQGTKEEILLNANIKTAKETTDESGDEEI